MKAQAEKKMLEAVIGDLRIMRDRATTTPVRRAFNYAIALMSDAIHLDEAALLRDPKLCRSKSPDRMCAECDCWKATRAGCS